MDNDGEDNKEDNINDEPSHHNEDGSESATISCPHPACKGKPPYSQRNNLQRHYTNHVECNETCVFCGHRSTLVRNYVTHFEKCKAQKNCNDSSRDKGRTATTKKRILSKVAANELDKMSKAGAKMREIEFHSEDNGRKRKSDAAVPSSQRRQTTTEDAPAPNSAATVTLDSNFALAGITASTTGLQVSSFMSIILLILP
ncbi:hypothetical protein K469DRAFT_55495 [Zopfia rhizophila CBS 207.26]|uniref:Uncharacterized protein n=1 Tax=Zopfia rhizophila CBS 207.26 TaxID=1314779 RepID=A0A6A6DDF0_9PEZI|nr:hypothetical protein K469DRAFT_55495 [Zopfia rhizophila CBS 207.26]